MRLIDADKLHIKLLDMEFQIQDQDQILDAMDDCAVDPPPNDPLTLSELREMDGEPVYFQFGDGAQGWGIVEIDVDSRKPEEGET